MRSPKRRLEAQAERETGKSGKSGEGPMLSPETCKRFAEWLREERRHTVRCAQKVLAKEAKVTEKTIRNIENGRSFSKTTFGGILAGLNNRRKQLSLADRWVLTWDELIEGKLPRLEENRVEKDLLWEKLAYDSKYRGWVPDAESAPRVTEFLQTRYHAQDKIFRRGSIVLPIAVLWSTDAKFDPDDILIKPIDRSHRSYTISENERRFLDEEAQKEPEARPEGVEYRMIEYSFTNGRPRLRGGIGLWYDHLLSQASLRWELAKALMENADLGARGTLPRREQYEEPDKPHSLNHASRRCGALGTDTLLVIKAKAGLRIVLPRRSPHVKQFPNMFDICPGSMFECASRSDYEGEWSIRKNIRREFLEEVLMDKEEIAPEGLLSERMDQKPAARKLNTLLRTGAAKLSLTGMLVDLTTLGPTLSTILVIDESDLVDLKPQLNWEFERNGAVRPLTATTLNELVQSEGYNICPTALVTVTLGIEWLRKQGYL